MIEKLPYPAGPAGQGPERQQKKHNDHTQHPGTCCGDEVRQTVSDGKGTTGFLRRDNFDELRNQLNGQQGQYPAQGKNGTERGKGSPGND